MRRRLLATLVLSVLVVPSALSVFDIAPVSSHETPATVVVKTVYPRWKPKLVRIHKGEKVRWKNADGLLHTITRKTGPAPFGDSEFEPNETYTKTFNKVGTYTYFCEFHPEMGTGTVVVVARHPSTGP